MDDYVFEEVTAFIQDEEEVVWILAGHYLRVDEFLVARPSGLLSVAAVLLRQGLPRHLAMLRPMFWPLSLELLNDVVGEARCGKK